MTSNFADVQRIIETLSLLRIGPQPEEYEIHTAISAVLESSGIEYIHECKLQAGRRIDFLCGSIGIEVKKNRPVSSRLMEQITRYLENPALTAIIVVLQKPCALPPIICGKPVYVIALNRLWGVALN